MSITLEQKWKGFKSTLGRIKNGIERMENPPEISVTFEFDNGVENYPIEEVPKSSSIIKDKSEDSQKITAFVYSGERLVHKEVLYEYFEPAPREQRNSYPMDNSNEQMRNEIRLVTDQIKMMITASDEINKMKMGMLTDTFQTQLKTSQEIYQNRETALQEISRRETEIRIKEIEANSKRKTELWTEFFKAGTDLVTGALTWVKSNPADAAEIISVLRSKPAN
ncbi:hypothetical protein [Leptospira ilyithenensis]|uniref:Uncharacterized protein n=1 Tax=Leptospira ilyithenensis TaxID=2484901 RepID=A0A4R9LS87_9LEPT|nr:hypothetical protein [Leptospira ilyithenensis]TGN09756.1 hypothetical protein EHS11_11785 [Leptospira ilyithenensis]